MLVFRVSRMKHIIWDGFRAIESDLGLFGLRLKN